MSAFLSALLLVQTIAAPGGIHDWTAVQQLVRGRTVSVATAGKKVTGDLVGVDDTSITIITAFGKRHRFDRAQVSEIRVRRSPVGKTAPVVTIAGVGLVVADAATRPAEAGPGVAWLIGMPMAILGGIALTQQLRPSELVYQRLPTPPVTRK